MSMEEFSKLQVYIDEFRVIRMLGQGITSQVYLVSDPSDHLFAAKCFIHQNDYETFENQINVMQKLSETIEHSNIIRIIGVREEAIFKNSDKSQEKCSLILLQYAKGGELFDFISIAGRLSESMARVYFIHLLEGLKFIHQNEIVHRDLKPENILLSSDFALKITDFGFSCFCNKKPLEQILGSKAYLAPQVYLKNYDGKKVDIFALGPILFTMVMGSNPFDHTNDPCYQHLKNKRYNVFWKIFKKLERKYKISTEFMDLFHKLVTFDPEERPSIDQILDHEWLKMDLSPLNEITEQFSRRLARVNSHKQKVKEAQQKKKKVLFNTMNGQQMNRSYVKESMKQLKEIFEKEVERDRNLQQIKIPQKLSLILDENNNIAFTFLYDYLDRKMRNPEQDEEQLETLAIKNDADKYIQLLFITTDEEDTVLEKTEFQIDFNLDEQSNLVLSFTHGSGSDIYFKKKYQEIRGLFCYCLKY